MSEFFRTVRSTKYLDWYLCEKTLCSRDKFTVCSWCNAIRNNKCRAKQHYRFRRTGSISVRFRCAYFPGHRTYIIHTNVFINYENVILTRSPSFLRFATRGAGPPEVAQWTVPPRANLKLIPRGCSHVFLPR